MPPHPGAEVLSGELPVSGFWTRDKIAELMYFWADGGSASWIGNKLGCSKNAVIGKVARLGLARRPSPIIRAATPVVRIHLPRTKQTTRMHSAPCSNGKVHECAWPIGEPGENGFHFCGQPTASLRKPYCAEHCETAYREPTDDWV